MQPSCNVFIEFPWSLGPLGCLNIDSMGLYVRLELLNIFVHEPYEVLGDGITVDLVGEGFEILSTCLGMHLINT
jgi:hypothetical protein